MLPILAAVRRFKMNYYEMPTKAALYTLLMSGWLLKVTYSYTNL